MSYDKASPEQCRELIRAAERRINDELARVDDIAKAHIPDFHFLDHYVSRFWSCDKSPIGMCVFRRNDEGRPTTCYYCEGPTERK